MVLHCVLASVHLEMASLVDVPPMTTTTVNGTAIQPAIDAAQPGDTLSLKAGNYAGRLKITKPLTIMGNGSVIDGGQGDGFVNIDVASKNVILDGLDLRHAGAAVRFKGDCAGSAVRHFTIPVVDWMVVNTGTPKGDDNGGNAFQFVKSTGPILIEDGTIRACRAVSLDYGRDGGLFEFFAAKGVTIRRVEGWDSVTIAESGKNSADPNNADILIEDCTFHGRPAPLTAASQNTVANGMYLRAVDRLTVQRCIFDQIDWWALLFNTGGNFGGPFSAVKVTDNTFRLAPNNRAIFADAGTPLPAISFDRNRYYTDPGTVVAELAGVKFTQLAVLQQSTGWELNNGYWGKEPVTPVDPCLQVKAERDQALADLVTRTSERNAAVGALSDANLENTRIRGLVASARVDLAGV